MKNKRNENWADKQMNIVTTAIACAITVALFLAAMIFLPPSRANGESLDVISISEYGTWDVEICSEELIEIEFEYNGDFLAMYWDSMPKGPLWVKIWNGIEAIDAGVILPMRQGRPALMQR